ncbi:MAG: hypothetical protein LBR41_02525 [Rickettsiales bacterium]|jgi:hypothetical protein|nr:hypothetical protein [Rickettsiales bacterium]
MPIEQIITLLKNSGFIVRGHDASFLYMETPNCLIRSLSGFIDAAWVAVSVMAALLIIGWAVALFRGVKIATVANNLKYLTIMLIALSMVKPIANALFGDDLFGAACGNIRVSIDEINRVLATSKTKLNTADTIEIYEIPPDALVVAETISETSNNNIVTVNISNGQVFYTNPDGTGFVRSGGTLAWRNNNPGNITCVGGRATRPGAAGCNGRFIVFPDENTGMRAITELLQSRVYNTLSVGAAIMKWAPPVENDTVAYQNHLARVTGLSLDRAISSLTELELSRVAAAIRQMEGFDAQRETRREQRI